MSSGSADAGVSFISGNHLRERDRVNYQELNKGCENETLDGKKEQCFSKAETLLPRPLPSTCDTLDQASNALADNDSNLNEHASMKSSSSVNQSCPLNPNSVAGKRASSDDEGNSSVGDDFVEVHIDEYQMDCVELAEESSDIASEDNSHFQPNEFFGQQLQQFNLMRPSFPSLRKISRCRATNLRYKNAHHNSTLEREEFYHDSTTEASESDCSYQSFEEDPQDDMQRKMKQVEATFTNQYSIDFDEYSMNPCKIPNEINESFRTVSDKVVAEKFKNWLSTSPFRIWFTKHSGNEPFAQCKYDHCRKVFSFTTNLTSANMLKHLQTNHRSDYDSFYSKIQPKQHVLSEARKPFQLCASLIEFYKKNSTMIKELNLFVENLVPFSLVESQSFRELFGVAAGKNKDQFVFSRKTLVKEITNYHDNFDKQLRFSLENTTKVNILLDIWSSAVSKSYLAISVSFCPNLDRLDQNSRREDVICRGFHNTHIIEFHDLSASRHTGEYLSQVLDDTLDQYSLKHKVASVTIDNATDNLAMLDKIEPELVGDGVNAEGGIIRIRCLKHVLNVMFKHIVEKFEKDNAKLLQRIDELTSKIKYNSFLGDHFKKYAGKATSKHDETRFIFRHKQLSSFLNLTDSLKEFYLKSYTYKRFQLKRDDSRLFIYEPAEIHPLKLFLKLTRVFSSLTMDMQDDALNNLPNGIQFYTLLHRYFEACALISKGDVSDENLKIAGIQLRHLEVVEEDQRSSILSTIVETRYLFEEYYNSAIEQIGYWVAHILRPDMKIQSISKILDTEAKELIVSKASSYVKYYFDQHKLKIPTDVADIDARTSCPTKERRLKKKLKSFNEFAGTLKSSPPERGTLLEWERYNQEPLDSRFDFIHYWMANREKFPRLSSLALSFYYTKLSTANVERCFSISRRAIEGRFSLSSANLERTMILRNRLKCFGICEKLKHITSIEEVSWVLDDMSDDSFDEDSFDEDSSSDQNSCSE
ncbi:putative transposase of the Rover1 hAT-like family [Lachancea sp. 'fantastica']|nr:putative transposase of the Rover1 hAT-like family [Lachancea sp. 'fantastica']